jgi:murein DD-endopeptidase MepM/ murein hydrolase activator NlpD
LCWLICGAGRVSAHEPGAASGWRAPVAGACITSPFGPRRWIGPHAPAGMHEGVDLRAPAGGVVLAIADGRVLGVSRRGAAGLAVSIRHGATTALYAHLGRLSPALAQGKSSVSAGEVIGVIGRTGVTYGTHLFLELSQNGHPIDPAPLLGVKPCP